MKKINIKMIRKIMIIKIIEIKIKKIKDILKLKKEWEDAADVIEFFQENYCLLINIFIKKIEYRIKVIQIKF